MLVRRAARIIVALVTLSGVAGADRAPAAVERRLRVELGPYVNELLQTDRLSVHTVVRTNARPRILVATPAGDSGAGLWFAPVSGPGLRLAVAPYLVEDAGSVGVAFQVTGPPRLELERVMLDSVRALRDVDHGLAAVRLERVHRLDALLRGPAGQGLAKELRARVTDWASPRWTVDPSRPGIVECTRRALGSGARYRLELIAGSGTRVEPQGERLVIAGSSGTRFVVRAFFDRPPLTPLASVLKEGDPAQARNLGLLSYVEKLLAGSYQYLTYFGRDTLLTAGLLRDRLTPAALGVAVASVLDRVSAEGRVAHEEILGDAATWEALPSLVRELEARAVPVSQARLQALETPRYDYRMIDGELLLPPVMQSFLSRASETERLRIMTPPRVEALGRVLGRVLDETERWPRTSSVADLVHLRAGEPAGNWRDSDEGLGLGRVPLDVNAYLAPAAIAAIADMTSNPVMQRLRGRTSADPRSLTPDALKTRAAAWRRARARFLVEIDAAQARARLAAYLESWPEPERRLLGDAKLWSGVRVVDAVAGGAAPELDRGLRFPGIALDAQGRPIPVLCSDEAFDLYYGEPTRADVLDVVTRLLQPFPVGLYTPLGLVVASPAYSDRREDARLFDRNHYHGTVIWSWPQILLRKGLERQRVRFDGDPDIERVTARAITSLDEADARTASMRASELWSWKAEGTSLVPQAFGASPADETEGAALLLLSNTR